MARGYGAIGGTLGYEVSTDRIKQLNLQLFVWFLFLTYRIIKRAKKIVIGKITRYILDLILPIYIYIISYSSLVDKVG